MSEVLGHEVLLERKDGPVRILPLRISQLGEEDSFLGIGEENVNRLFSIRLYHTPDGWVWSDHGGWGPGIFRWWIQALYNAIRDK